MKRCLNCRKTYDDTLTECPWCGYKPRTKSVTTRRLNKKKKIDISSNSSGTTVKKKSKSSVSSSSHTGAFYMKSGERLNRRYSVINVMGFGTFGVAYECFDNVTKKRVVVKEYMPSYLVTRSQNGRDAEPISDEAEVTFSIGCDTFTDENTKLSQNNVDCVPPLIECFRQNNTAYAVTELVGGESLSSVLLRKGKISYETTAAIITGVLQGLRRLNRIGSIHGDICPENIIIMPGNHVYLLDYNLSDFNKNMYTQRESGKPRPGYSALELYYKNLEIGPWTDVYAAAAVMYKMLTGITIPTAVKRSSGDTLTAVSKLGVPISVSAEKAMMKALKVDYKKRLQTPEDFLNGFVGDGFDNITAVKNKSKPQHAAVPSRRPRERDGSGFLKGLLVFLSIAIAAVVIWFFISGVFPMPEAISEFLGMSVSSSSDKDNISSNDTKSKQPEKDTDSEESEAQSSKKSSDGGLIDGLISRVASEFQDEVKSGVSSFIDEHFAESSRPEENTGSEPEVYYEEPEVSESAESEIEYYDENGGEYDDAGENSPGDDAVSESGGEDRLLPYGLLEDYASEAAEFVSDLF